MKYQQGGSLELEGKIALVTGGTKGIGKAIAQKLKASGATVVVTARSRPEESSSGIHFIAADLSQADEANKVVTQVQQQFGHLDILINDLGANTAPAGSFGVLSDADWDQVLCKSTCWLQSGSTVLSCPE